jgi:tetratricopeptide (TPR) repeat protein
VEPPNSLDSNDPGTDTGESWARIASELRTYRDAQRRAWGNLDDATIARFLAGEAPEEESERVRATMRTHPKVQECVDILRDVLGDSVEMARPEKPTVIPFRSRWARRPTQRDDGHGSRSLLRWTVAAALVLVFGIVLATRPPKEPAVEIASTFAEARIRTIKNSMSTLQPPRYHSKAPEAPIRTIKNSMSTLQLTAPAKMEKAQQLLDQGKKKEALALYKEVVEEFPGTREFGIAERRVTTITNDLTPHRPSDMFAQADRYLLEGKKQAAINMLERIIDEFPGSKEYGQAKFKIITIRNSTDKYNRPNISVNPPR